MEVRDQMAEGLRIADFGFRTSNFEILTKQWSSSCPSGNFALACHSEEGNDEESRDPSLRSGWQSDAFFAEFILSLSKGSEWHLLVSGWIRTRKQMA